MSTSPRRSSLGPLDPSWAEEYKKLLAVEAVDAIAEPEHEDSWLTPSQDGATGGPLYMSGLRLSGALSHAF